MARFVIIVILNYEINLQAKPFGIIVIHGLDDIFKRKGERTMKLFVCITNSRPDNTRFI